MSSLRTNISILFFFHFFFFCFMSISVSLNPLFPHFSSFVFTWKTHFVSAIISTIFIRIYVFCINFCRFSIHFSVHNSQRREKKKRTRCTRTQPFVDAIYSCELCCSMNFYFCCIQSFFFSCLKVLFSLLFIWTQSSSDKLIESWWWVA